MELMLILGAAWVISRGWRHVRADFGRSRDAHASEIGRKYPKGQMPAHVRRTVATRHAAGYTAREALRGFPVTRTGLRLGFLAHRAAVEQARAHADDARQTYADLREDIARRRAEREAAQAEAAAGETPPGTPAEQAQAVDELAERRQRKAGPDPEGSREGNPAGSQPSPPAGPAPGPYAPRAPQEHDPQHRCAVCGVHFMYGEEVIPLGDGRYAHAGHRPPAPEGRELSVWLRPGMPLCESCEGTGRSPDGVGSCPECQGWGDGPGDPDAAPAPDGTPCAACGQPGTEDDPVLRQAVGISEHRSHVTDDIARRQASRTAAGRQPDASRDPAPASPGGDTMPADTTFNSVTAAAEQRGREAEADAASARKAHAAALNDADAMTAAGVDPVVLDAQMNLVDLLDKAGKAHDAVLEQSGAVKSELARMHGGMQEAHDSAPGAVAEREFHGS